MSELWELSAEETARRVRAREVSAVEVTEAALARTARVEPLIHAWLELFEDEARERAAEVDRNPVGPLAGVTVSLKDNLVTEGLATDLFRVPLVLEASAFATAAAVAVAASLLSSLLVGHNLRRLDLLDALEASE